MFGIKWLKVVWMLNGSVHKCHFKFGQPNHSKSDQNDPPKWIPMYWFSLGMVGPIAVVLTIWTLNHTKSECVPFSIWMYLDFQCAVFGPPLYYTVEFIFSMRCVRRVNLKNKNSKFLKCFVTIFFWHFFPSRANLFISGHVVTIHFRWANECAWFYFPARIWSRL